MLVYRIEHKDSSEHGPWSLKGCLGIGLYVRGRGFDMSDMDDHHPGDGPGLMDHRHYDRPIWQDHNKGRFCGCAALADIEEWFPDRKGRTKMQRGGYQLWVYEADDEDVYEGISQVTFTLDMAHRLQRLSLVTFKPLKDHLNDQKEAQGICSGRLGPYE